MAENFTIGNTGVQSSELSMNLYGMPYQFPSSVDPRVDAFNHTVGKNFTQKYLHEAPILTLIPGKPKYLKHSNVKSKQKVMNTTVALLSAVKGTMSIDDLKDSNTIDNMRLYDFERSYNEYMQYVNIMCRTGASFLGINDTITAGGITKPAVEFDWRAYRYNINGTSGFFGQVKESLSVPKIKYKSKPVKPTRKDYSSKKKYNAALKKYKKDIKGWKEQNSKVKEYNSYMGLSKSKGISLMTPDMDEGNFLENFNNFNYIQFYVDPESGQSDTMANAVGESSMKSLFDSAGGTAKDLAFMANSGGIDTDKVEEMFNGAATGITNGVESILGGKSGVAGSVFDRLSGVAARVVKGENIIIPDVYQSSSYDKQYSVTIHLKSPYGSKLAYYLNIYVPLMHLLAFALPKQETANSYGAPFLVKGYIEGLWTINMGIVTDITVVKDTESLSVDGLPMSVDVTLSIKELYSDLSMSSQENPLLFINNSSLIEYLATTCGMSLTKPNLEAKYKMLINNITNVFKDFKTNAVSEADEFLTNAVNEIISLRS